MVVYHHGVPPGVAEATRGSEKPSVAGVIREGCPRVVAERRPTVCGSAGVVTSGSTASLQTTETGKVVWPTYFGPTRSRQPFRSGIDESPRFRSVRPVDNFRYRSVLLIGGTGWQPAHYGYPPMIRAPHLRPSDSTTCRRQTTRISEATPLVGRGIPRRSRYEHPDGDAAFRTGERP